MASKKAMTDASNNALNKFFTQGTETTQNGTETQSTDIPSPGTKKTVTKANKTVKKVFSFRGEPDDVIQWRLYADARSGMTMDEIGREALNEYMKNHPLSKVEKDVFNAKMNAMFSKK